MIHDDVTRQGGRPIASNTDPATSHASAEQHERTGQLVGECAQVYAILVAWVWDHGCYPTTMELAGGDRGLVHLYGRRLSDLRDQNHRVDNPTGDDGTLLTRRYNGTGRAGMLWRPLYAAGTPVRERRDG